jgi:hypothetical protein
MKLSLEEILKSLGWTVLLIGVFSAVLAVFGVDLNVVLAIAATMFGVEALISVLIDIGKWSGLVLPDTAGQWSAALNLVGIAGIAVTLYISPTFDFAAIDAQFQTLAGFVALIFGYVVQISTSKLTHQLTAKGLGLGKRAVG